jgi:protein-ribulosamine 3-kinase
MFNDDFFQTVAQQIGDASGKPFALFKTVAVGGGCINSSYRLEGETGAYFVKLNREDRLSMFEAEVSGLAALAATGTVRVPQPVCCGVSGDKSYMVIEYLQLRPAGALCDRLLGQRLAAMHGIAQPFFGWHRDNTIGSTPQINARHADWVEFFAQRRLGFQLKLAESCGFGGKLQRQGEKLMECLPVFFVDYQPRPSLLHGDLWGGNYAGDETGQPVIFDPACYYGDREADIAMTELFGGFGRDFKAAYADAYPLDAGFSTRKTLYNLYHILNHLNIFGGGYLAQAENMIGRLLATVR